ncbi:class I SAM-dependent methyltransferase [Acinetobacter soli]|uniref:class I SAM-dependent methyltransferase n=1 Tax=Acinetobacter soli TaxID=487316 RepID=UPI003018430C
MANVKTIVKQRIPKTYYELSASQVNTPKNIVNFFWEILKKYRPNKLNKVVDFGAGDARFSLSNHFKQYIGVEIDPNAITSHTHDCRVSVYNDCAFNLKDAEFDACIGNPPYVRHHDVESPWKEKTGKFLEHELKFRFNLHSNLFAYFIALGLIKTKNDGIVAQIIPYEWVSRPSYKGLRDLIGEKKWQVDIYCFQYPVFSGVLTTACITIIDKSKSNNKWNYYNINKNLEVTNRLGISGTGKEVLPYTNYTTIRTRRGISPGSQKIFTLTEGERIHNCLSKEDVEPCVTTLKGLPENIGILDQINFKKYYIDQGKRCWLIKSNSSNISPNLQSYLDNVPEVLRQNYTCTHQHPWYNYELYVKPQILIHSGFRTYGPKILVNKIGAIAVGSVMAIHSDFDFKIDNLVNYLKEFNFEEHVVAHSNNLKKIEVRQLNSVINKWINANEYKH